MKNKKGFTIVELVIVIAIIAILAAVLIPTFSNVIDKANQSACLQAAKTKFEEVYALDYSDGVVDGKEGDTALTEATKLAAKKITNDDDTNTGCTYTVDISSNTVTKFEYKDKNATATYDGTTWTTKKNETTA